jgi:hypothetical protein
MPPSLRCHSLRSFFKNADRVVRNRFDLLEFSQAIRQEAQSPPAASRRRRTTRQGYREGRRFAGQGRVLARSEPLA